MCVGVLHETFLATAFYNSRNLYKKLPKPVSQHPQYNTNLLLHTAYSKHFSISNTLYPLLLGENI